MEAKFQMELKSLSERKRRTFLRYLDRMGKTKEEDEDEEASGETKPQQNNWMEQAEKRLELLKLRVEKEGKDEDDDSDDWDDSDVNEKQSKMRIELVILGSLVLSTSVVGNAYYQKKQFYPSVVHITKSNPSMMVMYIQALVIVVLLGKLMKRVFFGQLRAAEVEHLIDRSWYAITETCLAFTVFREDFSTKFVALFTVLLFLKAFHWLVEDRVDYMERSPIISWVFHFRVTSLLFVLGALDWHFIQVAYQATLTQGASVQLVFGFEYAILLTMVAMVTVKYALHTYDINRENPWEDKAVFLLYAELAIGFIKVILYMMFMLIMIRVYTLPLFAVRPMYLAMRSFKKALSDVILSRRAIRNLNTLYPDATAEDLANTDTVCIICREEMVTGAKKLPCNHIFHATCLRSWFQRQQTCPTCRLEVLRAPGVPAGNPPPAPAAANMRPPQAHAAAAAAAPHPPPPPQAATNAPPAAQAGAQPPLPPFIPHHPPFNFPFPMPNVAHQGAANDGRNAADVSAQRPVMPPPFSLPPFIPFVVPPPRPPANLGALSDAELQAMEGQERRHLEARIRVLRDIQTLLDAAVLQMNQYGVLVARLEHESNINIETVRSTSEEASANIVPQTNEQEPITAATSSETENEVLTPEEETNLSDQERLRRRRLQRFMNGAEQN
uniref:RING-type E3 ubiquitin transferase n=1 Tax=Ceriodaphnia reticulata TaxID=302197 RepID=A0A4Y7LZM1_9CRUS|nr:EOG090X03TK [Ceriodaphnia reticulata]SVE72853.1 EOG090X03TK [Ceriodaphnia reticulata]